MNEIGPSGHLIRYSFLISIQRILVYLLFRPCFNQPTFLRPVEKISQLKLLKNKLNQIAPQILLKMINDGTNNAGEHTENHELGNLPTLPAQEAIETVAPATRKNPHRREKDHATKELSEEMLQGKFVQESVHVVWYIAFGMRQHLNYYLSIIKRNLYTATLP